MSLLDWAIVAVPLAIVLFISWRTRSHMRSVSDFLTAGRAAGRYLVATSAGTASFGAITAVMYFEIMCRSGVTVTWWEIVFGPYGAIVLFLSLSGFIIYRYRETRVMTLAQLFEIRYSRRFRILAGSLCFFSGLINFAIFPAVSARFFVNYIGLPQDVQILGHPFPTFGLVMPILIGSALYTTLMGGQLTVMVTDATEGLISGILYLIVGFALLAMFKWDQIFSALSFKGHAIGLLDATGRPVFGAPARSSGNWLLDPFDSPSSTADFNIWYVGIGSFLLVYLYMAWQGNQGFNCAAANPHEAKMGNILGNWRIFARTVLITLLGICALTVLRSPDYSAQAGRILADLNKIDQPQIRSQMLVPVTLGHVLPMGIKGCFAAIMFFAMLAGDGSYLHSWGSIFIQDVVMPIRKTALTPVQHIRLLRWSIAGVAIFAFLFSLFFKQTDAISLFFGVTGAIFGGGAGAVIIGGLYWKRGTNAGAWGAMLAGAATPIFGFGAQQMIAHYERAGNPAAAGFWRQFITMPWGHTLTGREIAFVSALVAIGVYIVLSLVTCRQPFNMEKLLHRGPYAVREDQAAVVRDDRERTWVSKILGWDKHFTFGDKWISGGLFAWSAASVLVVAAVTTWNITVSRWPLARWSGFWWIYLIVLPLLIGSVAIIWLTWGVIRDMRRLFIVLREARRLDVTDDGTVGGPAKAKELR
jgi:SSS family solute:Na+ symporter